MAVVTGTVHTAWGFSRPVGNSMHHTISAKEQEVDFCFVTVTFPAGTYADADEAQFDPTAAIEGNLHNGKTVVPIGACMARGGKENGSIVGASVTGVSGNNVAVRLLQEDLATERADGVMSSTWEDVLVFGVTYYSPINGE